MESLPIELVVIIILFIPLLIYWLFKPSFDIIKINGINYRIMWYNVINLSNIKTRKYKILWEI